MEYTKFKTKKALEEYTRGIVNSIGECDKVPDEHMEFFEWLFKRHHNYENKKGYDYIYITPNTLKIGSYTIMMSYNDKEDESISWVQCVKNRPNSPENKKKSDNERLVESMRNSINYQILDFKTENPIRVCEFCKSEKDMNVDHSEPQFFDIKNEFLSSKSEVPTEFDADEHHRCCFKVKDVEFGKEWNKFHKEKANLRWLCGDCNRRRQKSKKKF